MFPPVSRQSHERYLLDLARRAVSRRKFQKAIRTRHFSIIACNCWGAGIYKDLEIPYQTPFIGLYLHHSCFLGFLENFEAAIRAPLEFMEESRYNGRLPFPIGLIMGAYEIHFMHYHSQQEARDKWERRRERIAADVDDRFFMLMHVGADYVPDLRRFLRLPFKNKVLFTDRPISEVPEAVVVPPMPGATEPDNGVTLYRRCHHYFDLPAWLNKDSSPSLAFTRSS
jgi:uncharacterized protein (DUF1919 family)